MRIMSLGEMLTDLRHEARLSADPAHGTHLRARYISLLARIQEELYDSYEWPSLQGFESVRVAAGARYSAYPDRTTNNGVLHVYAKPLNETQYRPLTYGIDIEQLNTKDSDAGERDDPIQRWEHYIPDGTEVISNNMFQVWPIPLTDTVIRFERKRALAPLSDTDQHSSTLDGPAIILHAAAEILAGQGAADAQLKLGKATTRVDLLRAREASVDNRPITRGYGRNVTTKRGPKWPTS
jgi:hypothetical protein